MIDRSLVNQLEIQGEPGQRFLSTITERNKHEHGVKVNFINAPASDQLSSEVTVREA